jgi:hypothetical protein
MASVLWGASPDTSSDLLRGLHLCTQSLLAVLPQLLELPRATTADSHHVISAPLKPRVGKPRIPGLAG